MTFFVDIVAFFNGSNYVNTYLYICNIEGGLSCYFLNFNKLEGI